MRERAELGGGENRRSSGAARTGTRASGPCGGPAGVCTVQGLLRPLAVQTPAPVAAVLSRVRRGAAVGASTAGVGMSRAGEGTSHAPQEGGGPCGHSFLERGLGNRVQRCDQEEEEEDLLDRGDASSQTSWTQRHCVLTSSWLAFAPPDVPKDEVLNLC